jgi:predicted GNAT family acetyltransferase
MHGAYRHSQCDELKVAPIAQSQTDEALAFLNQRPLHTVIMAGLLRDFGPVCPTPSGIFYGSRRRNGELNGVALIGRATMFETRDSTALAGFAGLAGQTSSVKMIMGEESDLRRFLELYQSADGAVRRRCRELLYQFTATNVKRETEFELQPALLDDLDSIVSAHAQMVWEESGVDPLSVDASGFRERCARRVERGRVWTLKNGGDLIFKADVVTETPAAAYIEGVWVNPNRRREGYARRCWAGLSRVLLEKWPAFCGFVNPGNPAARNFYEEMGGALIGRYDKVYL